MGSLNKAILIGNLGRDAEMRYTAGGTPVSNFSIATTEKFTDRDGQKREDTQWHRIILWGKTAESLNEYLTKGKQVYVEGRIETREWTNKEGQKVKTTEIKADRIVLLGGGGNGGQSSGGSSRSRGAAGSKRQSGPAEVEDNPVADAPIPEDDIPFVALLPLLIPALSFLQVVASA